MIYENCKYTADMELGGFSTFSPAYYYYYYLYIHKFVLIGETKL